MTTHANEFKNENITVRVNRKPHCLVELHITVTPEGVKASYHKALKNVSKEVSIPGFRKGRAPEQMLVSQYPKQIDREFRDIVLNTAYREALTLTEIYPYREKDNVKNLSVKKCSRDEGAEITLEYESFPDVPSIDPANLHLKKETAATLSERDVEDELQQLAYRQATWEDVVDRAVQEGDFVDIDIIALEEGEERSICQDTRFLVAQGKMGDWMRHVVIGLKTGESGEGMSEKEKDEPSENFKPTLCRIIIKAIKTAQLPELDDEFAKKFGATDFTDLKEKLNKTMMKRLVEEGQAKSRKFIQEEILKHYSFDLPASLLDAEKKARLEGKMHWLQHQKLSKEEHDRLSKKFKEEVLQEASNALRIQYILYKVIQDHKIEVSQDELLQELVKQMMLPQEERIINDRDDIEATRSELRRVIIFRKALDYLIHHAQDSAI